MLNMIGFGISLFPPLPPVIHSIVFVSSNLRVTRIGDSWNSDIMIIPYQSFFFNQFDICIWGKYILFQIGHLDI